MLNMPNSNVCLCVKPTGMMKSFHSSAILLRSRIEGASLPGRWFVFYGENNAPFKFLCRARDGFDFGLAIGLGNILGFDLYPVHEKG